MRLEQRAGEASWWWGRRVDEQAAEQVDEEGDEHNDGEDQHKDAMMRPEALPLVGRGRIGIEIVEIIVFGEIIHYRKPCPTLKGSG